ncbi:MAG TPA: XRE family transcriptional regulator [Bryobacteraceae bacterium]|jgi:transcriptional regulator with XRE-family HTH domain|nr:XRE family transcriptional regulator [Bryobacteraceae bacterium]
MDVPLVIKHRLRDMGLEQRELAAAAHVTESYVSQLLARKKAPPAPRRTDIYDRMEVFLQLPRGELSRLAEIQRKEELKKRAADPIPPLFPEFRALILRKCRRESQARVRAILEKEAFGELERLVAQKLLDVAGSVAGDQVLAEKWVGLAARLTRRTRDDTRAALKRLKWTDVFRASLETRVPFLDSLIESWTINLETFGVEIVVNRAISPDSLKRFEFVEQETGQPVALEPGLEGFLEDKSLSGDVTEEEVAFMKRLNLKGRRPFPIYYYRELQNLRDPVHFRDSR